MIIAKMMGNIGNQMFIYAMARSIQLEYKDKLIIDLSGLKRYYYTANYKLDQFNLSEDISYDIQELSASQKLKYRLSSNIFHFQHFFYRKTKKDLIIPNQVIKFWFERGCYYNTNRSLMGYPHSEKKDKYLYGYFQSEEYFKKYADQIKNDLTVKTPVSDKDMKLIEQMQKGNSIGVSIRADKAPENPKVKDNVNLGFIAEDYYYKGMEIIAQKINNPEFYIFADNIDIVKREYKFPFSVTYIEPEDSATGMRLLYNCKHFVIANSTFSWWGAYLGRSSEKVIVMPAPWDRYGPLRECIYMKNAIRIPCKFRD